MEDEIGLNEVDPDVATGVGASATLSECEAATPATSSGLIGELPQHRGGLAGVPHVRGFKTWVSAAAPLTVTAATTAGSAQLIPQAAITSAMYQPRLLPKSGAGIVGAPDSIGATETADTVAVTLELKASYARAIATTALATQVEADAKRTLNEHHAAIAIAIANANGAVAVKH